MNPVKKILSALLICSVAVCAIPASTAAAQNTSENTSDCLLQRVNVSANDTLLHYELQDAQGNTVSVKSDTAVSRKKSILPASYRCDSDQNVTSVKDQGVSGSCWAFAAIKSLESNSVKQNLLSLEEADLSENHLAWYSYHGVTDPSDPLYGDENRSQTNAYMAGGDIYMAAATLANGWGAAAESDAPFCADNERKLLAMSSAMTKADASLRYQSKVRLHSAICYDGTDRNAIKEALMEYGAVDVAVYCDMSDYYEAGNSFYQNDVDAAYSNHCVTIIGWDDTFDDFDPDNSPSKSGAWLIANSYGTDIFENGLCWLSYEDTSICDFCSYIADKNTYDTYFQYDGVGYYGTLTDAKDKKTANVFTNNETAPQLIQAAGFYTTVPNQKYKIEVYRNLSGSTPDTGTLVKDCTATGTIDQPGYYTVSLNQSLPVGKGESFAVVVTYYTVDDTSYVPVEGVNSWGRNYYTLSSKTGQSYIYSTSEKCWKDTTAYPLTDERNTTQITNLNNLCIKALASTLTEEEYKEQLQDIISNTVIESITASTQSYTIGAGEKVTLNLKTTPSVSSEYLTFTSSDDTIASVSKSGTVTGNATGTAQITASFSDDVFFTTKITVKNAPSKVSAVLTKKKIKVKKTAQVSAKLPAGSASYKITYKSLNKKIATVNSKGKITAKKKGTVKIQIATYNGKTAVATLKIVK